MVASSCLLDVGRRLLAMLMRRVVSVGENQSVIMGIRYSVAIRSISYPNGRHRKQP